MIEKPTDVEPIKPRADAKPLANGSHELNRSCETRLSAAGNAKKSSWKERNLNHV